MIVDASALVAILKEEPDFGDCFAYALAKAAREPLLFKGDDFSQMDVAAA